MRNAKVFLNRLFVGALACVLGILVLLIFAPTSIAGLELWGLWLPNMHGISAFAGKQLTTSGAPSPAVTDASADLQQFPEAILFDRFDNLWSSTCAGGADGHGSLTEFLRGQLNGLLSSNAPPAQVVLSNNGKTTTLDCPIGVAFDRAGTLWAADAGTHSGVVQLVGYTATQYRQTGAPLPRTTIRSALFGELAGLAFDRRGSLWVVDDHNDKIFQFTLGQLARAGLITSAPYLTLSAATLDFPFGIAFDKRGNLWVANCSDPVHDYGSVQKFSAQDLHGKGLITPTPAITLSATGVATHTGSTQSIFCPQGITFDQAGDLWVSNSLSDTKGSIAEFTPNQLASSGSPAPRVFLDANVSGSNVDNPTLIAFGPSVP